MLKNEVLYLLEQRKGSIVTGGQLASSLGVSRTAIWKAIRSLQEDGNEIVSFPNSGYKLMDTSDTLFERMIHDYLRTTFIGHHIAVLSSVHSTNQYLKEQDISVIPDGYVVIADEQISGRGRRNRPFLSPKSKGIYLSILLKLDGLQNDIRLLTICAAVAVSKAIETVCNIKAFIKWVNDIYCNGKKICGILTEAVLSAELQELSTVMIGIGINTGNVPPEIGDIATSIQEETGLCGIRNRLIAEVLNQFEAVYLDCFRNGNFSSTIEYYESKLFMIGKQILVTGINHSFTAAALGIDEIGALIVKDDRGVIQHITSGEIQLDWGNQK